MDTEDVRIGALAPREAAYYGMKNPRWQVPVAAFHGLGGAGHLEWRAMRKTLQISLFLAALALTGLAVPAHAEEPFTEYRLVDATSFWVLHNDKWQRLKLAWVDGPDQNANRPLSHRLELPMSYTKLRIEWVRWLRQVDTFRKPSVEALRRVLDESDEYTWEEIPQAGPRQRSSMMRSTKWARVEVDGDDLGRKLIESGWAIPLLPVGVAEPGDWQERLESLQESMDQCRGMWRTLLQQCFIQSQKETDDE